VVPAPPCGALQQACCTSGTPCTSGVCKDKVCTATAPETCSWHGWGCGVQKCGAKEYLAGVDFNATKSEECWGKGGNFDEPKRRIKCCGGPAKTGAERWSGLGCGELGCFSGEVVSGVDFNATQSEGCWGTGSDFDEPQRRLRCCPF
jgi:hypothetical protein